MLAIVGNSGSILNYEDGEFIDSHEKVIRFNTAPIEGFEKYVGKKTSERWIAYHGKNYNFKNEEIVLYSYNQKALKEAIGKLKNNNIRLLPKSFVNGCDDLISKPYWKWRFIPGRIIIHKKMSTTGLKAIVWHLMEEINIFGFGESKQFHYWEQNREGYNFTNSHSYKEKEIIKKLEDEGKIKIFS